jgi:carboxyl-terminal processing protease
MEKGEVVIIVDEGSASASEVVAGALQDWDRATIVGRRTFGKGLVQEQYELSNGAALRLTVARYYTPAGRSIQKSYVKGRDAYREEVLERFESGEMIHPDTLKIARGEAFKTTGGRTVYGGGGITPDVFVPFDTTGFSTDISPLFEDQAFGKFIYTYYTNNRRIFDQFKTPADFAKNYTDTELAWSALMNFLQANSIRLPQLSERDKEEVKKRIKTWMARQIWRMQGYYEVSNRDDKTVQKAIEVIK